VEEECENENAGPGAPHRGADRGRSSGRRWSLPGGVLEPGETLEQCLVREVEEETGLRVAVDRLLDVCDRMTKDEHVVHITFAVRRTGGELRKEPSSASRADGVGAACMVPLAELCQHGFGRRFQRLVEAGFPDAGTYRGRVTDIGL
jgi:ADP-ribose pyrophosphatase YjhB (NUDIX family)